MSLITSAPVFEFSRLKKKNAANWMVMTHFTGRDEAAVFICSLDSSVKKPHIFNFNKTSSNDSQLSLLLLQMKWDSITSQDCQSRDIFYLFSDSRTCLCTCYF